jgi:hypothetical protein
MASETKANVEFGPAAAAEDAPIKAPVRAGWSYLGQGLSWKCAGAPVRWALPDTPPATAAEGDASPDRHEASRERVSDSSASVVETVQDYSNDT